jgi:SAM-dependent methyltransferase
MEDRPLQKMYTELAAWWPLLSPVADYAEEAAFFLQVMKEKGLPPAPSLLELGSGGGSNAFHLKRYFARMTLADLSAEMLAISRMLNPECEHFQGDMRTLRLGQRFDVVFIHDAIDYMLTLQELRQAFETAGMHCQPQGLALFVPDHLRETFQPSSNHGGTDGERQSLRYLEWTYDPDPRDSTYIMEFVYLLREGNYETQIEHDKHICGLFARADWIQLLQEAGFEPEVIRDPFERELFLARKVK